MLGRRRDPALRRSPIPTERCEPAAASNGVADPLTVCVGLAVPATAGDGAGWFVLDEPGMGQASQSFAKAVSERIRSGLSLNTMRNSAAESAPMPYASRSVGDA